MAIFLETSDAYRLFQRELPQGVYPDGAPSGFYSTASIYSKSKLVGDAYRNMQVVYNNIFPQTADEQQEEQEMKVFGYTLDASLPLADRQAAVISKLRHKPGITISDMVYLVKTVVGTGVDVQIGEWQNESGSWLIGVSELGVTTIFGSGNLLYVTPQNFPGVDLCNITAAEVGLTEEEFLEMQEAAYTYSVLIYLYTLTAEQRARINQLLTDGEPARSTHVIYDGLFQPDENWLLDSDDQVIVTDSGEGLVIT